MGRALVNAAIPAGTAYATEVVSGHARWVLSGANGNGLRYWSAAGEATESYAFTKGGTKSLEIDLAGDVTLVLPGNALETKG